MNKDMHTRDFKTSLRKGLSALIRGMHDEAIEPLLFAHQIDPKDIRPSVGLSIAYLRKNEPERALDIIAIALKTQEHHELYHQAGLSYEQRGDIRKAIGSFRKSALLGGGAEAHDKISRLCYQQGDLPAAIDSLKEGIAIDQDDPMRLSMLGSLLLESGKIAEAISAFHASAALLRHPYLYEKLGDAYSVSGNRKKAVESYTSAIDLGHPDRARVEESIRLLDGLSRNQK